MATQPDKLRMAEEFEMPEMPAETKPVEQPKTEPQKFFREIDLGDGSGKQRFEADSMDALADKLAEAQVHATKKIQQLSRQSERRLEPEKQSSDFQEFKPSTLKAEELAQFQSNPHEMFRRTFQAETGMTPQDFREWINIQRRQQAEMDAQQQFVRKHSSDYTPTAENAQRIMNFLQAENLPVSKRNLDYAFDQLRAELASSAERARPVAEVGKPAQPAPKEQVSPPPSFLRPSLGGPARIDTSGGNEDAELSRIARSESLSDLRARIEHMARQQRSAR